MLTICEGAKGRGKDTALCVGEVLGVHGVGWFGDDDDGGAFRYECRSMLGLGKKARYADILWDRSSWSWTLG